MLTQQRAAKGRNPVEDELCAIAGLVAFEGVHAYKVLKAAGEDVATDPTIRAAAAKGMNKLKAKLTPGAG